MPVGKNVRSLFEPSRAKAMDRTNIRRALSDLSFPEPPADQDAIAREVSQASKKAPEDFDLWVNYGGGSARPDEMQAESMQEFGSPQAREAYTLAMRDALAGRRVDTLDNSITYGLPTHRATAPVWSESMGTAEKPAMTLFTPRKLLDNLTADPAHSQKILDRIQERNLPDGMGDAEIYHLDNLGEKAEAPWLMFRDMANKLAGGARSGSARVPHNTIFMNRNADPGLDAPKMMSSQPLNVAEHEGIHSILHSSVWTPEFQKRLYNRPVLTDIADPRQVMLPSASYLGSKSQELQNALFHAKRMTEVINPQMRDVGESAESLDEWLEFMRQYQGKYGDPMVTKPGHYLEGQPARGYNSLMESLQQIDRSLGPDGKQDLRNMNFKTSDASPIRKALLS
jgi:hypothetical protein